MTATLIILGTLYMIPGFIFGIFAWDAPTTGPLDYVKRVGMHILMTVGWLLFVLWCINPWSVNSDWKEYFKNYHGSDKHLRRTFGRDYDKMMKKYGKYIPKNNN